MVERLWWQLLQEEASLDSRFRPSHDAVARWQADYPVWLKDSTRIIALAGERGEEVGFVSAHLWGEVPILEQVVEVFVEYLFVTREARRAGIGRTLVNHVSEWGSRFGASRLRFRSLAMSGDAAEFWRRYGAEPYAVEMLFDLETPPQRPRKPPLGFRGNPQ